MNTHEPGFQPFFKFFAFFFVLAKLAFSDIRVINRQNIRVSFEHLII